MAAVLERTRHKQGWLGAELDPASLYWDFKPAHLRAIDELMEKLKGSGLAFHQIEKRHFSHPALDADLAKVLRRIKTGPGLLIMRGFPVDKYSAEEMQSVYWGIGAHFGRGCSQSADGDYLGHVTNVEKQSRGYTTARELNLHTEFGRDRRAALRARRAGRRAQHLCQFAEGARDRRARAPRVPADTGARLPLRPPRRGGAGRGPGDALSGAGVLGEGRRHDLPLCARGDRQRRRRARRTAFRLESEALAFFEEVAQRDEVRFEVMLRPGEASFIDNYEILHARTGVPRLGRAGEEAAAVPAVARRRAARPMLREVHLYQNRSGHMGVDPQPGRGPR